MKRIVAACLFTFLLPIAAFAQQRVLVVDNRVSTNGDGTVEHPFKTITAALDTSSEGDIIYVTPSSDAYAENVTLKPGQKLVGTNADETIRSLGIDLPDSASAATIQGSVIVKENNIIAGLTIVADHTNGVSGTGSAYKITLRNVRFKTANGMFGLLLADHAGDVTLEGGGLEATDGGGGVSITGGVGNVLFDNFPMSGTFSTAVLVNEHHSGFIVFREGSTVRVDDSTQDAVVALNMPARARLVFGGGLQIRSTRRRGLIASHVLWLGVAGSASITTSNAAALELTDVTGDIAFDSVSAEGSALPHGIRMDHVRGRVAINAGTIRIASSPAIDLDDVGQTSIKGLLIDGGKGIVATRLHDVTFEQLDVRNATNVMLNDLEGSVQFNRCSFAVPLTIDQRMTNGGVIFDRCRFSAPVKLLSAATTSLTADFNGAEVSGSSLSAVADDASTLRVQVAGGHFNGANVDVTAAGTSTVCTEVSAVKFAPVEKAIRFSAVEGTKMTIVGAKSNDVSAIRSAVAVSNNGAGVAIEAPASAISSASKCP
jgi:hypothetical protein